MYLYDTISWTGNVISYDVSQKTCILIVTLSSELNTCTTSQHYLGKNKHLLEPRYGLLDVVINVVLVHRVPLSTDILLDPFRR